MLEVVLRADEALGELADGGLDRALGLDGGDGEGGDEGEGAEDDEGDKGRGEHARGDLGAPVLEDRPGLVGLAKVEVVLEPAAADHVERGCCRPVDEVDEGAGLCLGDVGAELGLESGCDAPYVVIHVAYVLKGECGGNDASHPSVLWIRST